MENDEYECRSQPAETSASSAARTGRHDSGNPQERSTEGDSALAADRSGVITPEQPEDPNDADWRYLYSVVRECFNAERERTASLDAKVGVLLAGAIAAMAFTYANGPTGWWSLVLLVFLLPLGFLFQAFRTRLGKDAPAPEPFADKFPYYPTTTLRIAISDMVTAGNLDRELNDKKANRIDLAMVTLGLAFVLILMTQVAARLHSVS